MGDELSKHARAYVDAQHGEGYFDDTIARGFANRLDAEFDPEKQVERAELIEELDYLLDFLISQFAQLHAAFHLDDQNYVEYATITLSTQIDNMDPQLIKTLLFQSLEDLGTLVAHSTGIAE